ncbi:MAG TPA: hypothetical protein VNH65_17730 [Candidatus Acidoferrum sp.]|nr:hypothetical protein [Candidatus Acidoferrum sp.]
MQCKDIELVLEQEGLEPLPEEARAHLAECHDCRSYVADLTSLVDAARKLPCEIAPPDRIWISLRAQLEEEGIIKSPAEAARAQSVPFWKSISDFFRSRALATAMVGILLVAATVFQIRRDRIAPVAPPVQTATAEVPPLVQKNPVPAPSEGFDRAARALDDQEPVATGMILASTSPVDISLRDNLKKVNEFIADCQRHLKEQPQDGLTREYLSAAYEQKAELLSAMIERGRSVN